MYYRNRETQRRLRKQGDLNYYSPYYDVDKGKWLRNDLGKRRSQLKLRVGRQTRRKLNRSSTSYSKSNIKNKISEFWYELD